MKGGHGTVLLACGSAGRMAASRYRSISAIDNRVTVVTGPSGLRMCRRHNCENELENSRLAVHNKSHQIWLLFLKLQIVDNEKKCARRVLALVSDAKIERIDQRRSATRADDEPHSGTPKESIRGSVPAQVQRYNFRTEYAGQDPDDRTTVEPCTSRQSPGAGSQPHVLGFAAASYHTGSYCGVRK